jgi:hypothetical protein
MPDPLYRTEIEVARAVLGRCSLEEWKGLAVVLEREGLPKVVPEFGRRYWPAVKAWFDFYNRVDKIAAAPPRRPRRETWPTSKPRALTGAPARTADVLPIGSRRTTT